MLDEFVAAVDTSYEGEAGAVVVPCGREAVTSGGTEDWVTAAELDTVEAAEPWLVSPAVLDKDGLLPVVDAFVAAVLVSSVAEAGTVVAPGS